MINPLVDCIWKNLCLLTCNFAVKLHVFHLFCWQEELIRSSARQPACASAEKSDKAKRRMRKIIDEENSKWVAFEIRNLYTVLLANLWWFYWFLYDVWQCRALAFMVLLCNLTLDNSGLLSCFCLSKLLFNEIGV